MCVTIYTLTLFVMTISAWLSVSELNVILTCYFIAVLRILLCFYMLIACQYT